MVGHVVSITFIETELVVMYIIIPFFILFYCYWYFLADSVC